MTAGKVVAGVIDDVVLHLARYYSYDDLVNHPIVKEMMTQG